MNLKKPNLKIPKKIMNFFLNKVFGKVASAFSLYLLGKYTYNKLQVKKQISEIQVLKYY